MNRPIIALTPMIDSKQGRWYMKPEYMRAVLRAGGVPVMMPRVDGDEELRAIAETMDGFLFTGGPDLDPVLYGQEKIPECGAIVPKRDATELKLMRLAVELDKPVLGICRGLQVLNVALGGALYQDIPTQAPSELHHQVTEKPHARITHHITVSPEFPFGSLPLTHGVNSRHHQAIRDLAPGLEVRARATDGIIEAVWMPGKRHVRAVQWHPENFDNELSRVIFEDFVEAAK